MQSLKRIHTHNIQSHEDVDIILPKVGIVAFTGNNSNGKSVIVKVTNAVLSGALTRPKERRTLINKHHLGGSVLYERYDGMSLYVNIHVEAAQTFAELTYPNGEKVRRYLADKTLGELVTEFGFHYNKEHEVSLNVHNDDDKFLFVNTKHSTNYACLSNTLTDEYGERSIEQLNITLDSIKDDAKNFDNIANTAKVVLSTLTECDIEEETKRRKKLLYIAQNLQHFPEHPCPKVEKVPDIITLDLSTKCPKVKYPVVVNLPKIFPDIIQQGRDLNDILKGVCPVCKRAFFS